MSGNGWIVLTVRKRVQPFRELLDLETARVRVLLKPTLQYWQLRQRVEHQSGASGSTAVLIVIINRRGIRFALKTLLVMLEEKGKN